jgi:hypothetical protein
MDPMGVDLTEALRELARINAVLPFLLWERDTTNPRRPSAVKLRRLADRLSAELEDGRSSFPSELLAAYGKVLLGLSSMLETILSEAPRDSRGLPDVAGIEWDARDPTAGTVPGVPPFSSIEAWKRIAGLVRESRELQRQRRQTSPSAQPPPAKRRVLPAVRTVCDQSRAKAVRFGRSLAVNDLTIDGAKALLRSVRFTQVHSACGCPLPREVDPDLPLVNYTDLIIYVGPGFAGVFDVNGLTSRDAPEGASLAVSGIRDAPPGFYWESVKNLPKPPGYSPQHGLTFRLDRGLSEPWQPILIDFQWSPDRRSAFEEWRRDATGGLLFVYGPSYWNRRGGVLRFVERANAAGAVAMRHLKDEGVKEIKNITAARIAVSVIIALLGKAALRLIPGIGLIGVMDDAQAAGRLGQAAGMAAWGTTEEDIDVAGRLIARELAEYLVAKAEETAIKAGGKAVKATGLGGGRGRAPSTPDVEAPTNGPRRAGGSSPEEPQTGKAAGLVDPTATRTPAVAQARKPAGSRTGDSQAMTPQRAKQPESPTPEVKSTGAGGSRATGERGTSNPGTDNRVNRRPDSSARQIGESAESTPSGRPAQSLGRGDDAALRENDRRVLGELEQEVNAERAKSPKGLPAASVSSYAVDGGTPGSWRKTTVPRREASGELAEFEAFGGRDKDTFEWLARVPENDYEWGQRGNQLKPEWVRAQGQTGRVPIYRHRLHLKRDQAGAVSKIASQRDKSGAGALPELPPEARERLAREGSKFADPATPPRKTQYYRPGGFDVEVADDRPPQQVGWLEADNTVTLFVPSSSEP